VTPELPLLILITDWQIPEPRLFEALSSALALGPEVALQHRHPGASDRAFFGEGERLARLCRHSGNPLFVNGRLDVALVLGVHLHLPARGVPAEDARAHLGPAKWISCAVHDAAEARAAAAADIALVSPVFPPGSKATDPRPPLGPEGFAQVARVTPCPAFALGGIGPESAEQVRGAFGFAAISAVLKAPRPDEAARSLLSLARKSRSSTLRSATPL
jgi:thiamine-phosphate pyrophosphorylase